MAVTGLGSANAYITNSNSSSGRIAQNKGIEKKPRKKFAPQNHYEKRKYLREQFEEKQALDGKGLLEIFELCRF